LARTLIVLASVVHAHQRGKLLESHPARVRGHILWRVRRLHLRAEDAPCLPLVVGAGAFLDELAGVIVSTPPDRAPQPETPRPSFAFHVGLPVRSLRPASATARTHADALTSACLAARTMAPRSFRVRYTTSSTRSGISGGRPSFFRAGINYWLCFVPVRSPVQSHLTRRWLHQRCY